MVKLQVSDRVPSIRFRSLFWPKVTGGRRSEQLLPTSGGTAGKETRGMTWFIERQKKGNDVVNEQLLVIAILESIV